MPNLIEVSHLQKVVGQNVVLSVDALDVEAGEIEAVVGPPDSGKTLLFDILAGRVKATAGSVQVAGHDLARNPSEARRRTGALFSDNALYSRRSVRFNLDFQRRLHSLPVKRTDEVLASMELAACAQSSIDTLPYGMQRRLALGRAIVHDPAVLLLDDPIAGVDAESTAIITRAIAGLAESGAAVLMFTDDLVGLGRLCHNIHEMSRGRIVSSYAVGDERKPVSALRIPVRSADKVVLVNPAEVLYARSEGGQTYLRTPAGEVSSNLSLSDLEARLLASGFFRTHRAYLGNLQRIKEIVPYTRDSYTLTLDDDSGTEIPLSKASAKQLQTLLGY